MKDLKKFQKNCVILKVLRRNKLSIYMDNYKSDEISCLYYKRVKESYKFKIFYK